MNIKVRRMVPHTSGKIKAFADITIGDTLVKGFRVVEGTGGKDDFIGLPSIKGSDGNWYANFKPGETLMKSINDVIFKSYIDLEPQTNLPLNDKKAPSDIAILSLDAEKSLYSDATTFYGEPVKYFAEGNVKAYDFMGYRFMRQNPVKKDKDGNLSKWAQMVKDGDKVTWVVQGGVYIGRVVNSVYQQC